MADENDFRWTTLKKPHERLRWARSRREEFQTQEAFAEAVGMKRGAYRKYEADPDRSDATEMTYNQAIPWARRLRVRWEWLLEGKGQPWLSDSDQRKWSQAQEKAAFLLEDRPVEDQERIVQALEQLLKVS